MIERVVVLGAGGHGKVVADAILAAGELRLDGFLDDTMEVGRTVAGVPVVGGFSWLQRGVADEVTVALGIGDNADRARIGNWVEELGYELAVIVHPRACVSGAAHLGAGVFVAAGAVVNSDARVEGGAVVNTSAVVEHDASVGAYSHVCPNACIGGKASLGARGLLGIGAVLLPKVATEEDCVVGAGAVVTQDVPAGTTVVGVPARALGSRRPPRTQSGR